MYPLVRASIILLLLAACAGSKPNTVGEGRLQKRTFRPGLHVDLHRSRPIAPRPDRIAREPKTTERRNILWPVPAPPADAAPLASAGAMAPPPAAAQRTATTPSPVQAIPQAAPRPDQEEYYQEDLMPRKRLQPLAIPAFLVAVGAILLGFQVNNILLVVALLVVAITLAGVSLRRMRDHDRSGKGFALPGMVLALVALLFAAMQVLRTGL